MILDVDGSINNVHISEWNIQLQEKVKQNQRKQYGKEEKMVYMRYTVKGNDVDDRMIGSLMTFGAGTLCKNSSA